MNLLNMLDKKIVFFGSGSFLDRIMKYPIPFPFSYIVDNNQDKWGNIKYGKEIKNPDYLLKENKDDLLILVVSSFYDEIASQLEKMGFEVNNNYMSIFDFIILLKYKNLYSKKISLPFFNNEIFINPLDKRVKNLFLYKFHDNSRKNIKLWMTLVSTFDPTIVLDVGANYGEYMFSPIYKKYVSIIGIEANKNLIPYLNDSKNMHPNNYLAPY